MKTRFSTMRLSPSVRIAQVIPTVLVDGVEVEVRNQRSKNQSVSLHGFVNEIKKDEKYKHLFV